MQKIVCLVSVILVSGIVGVDSLQCYVCLNCTSPTDADVMTCGDPGTTVAPPDTTMAPPQTTVAPPQTTVTPPQTTGAPPQTTVAPPQTTGAPPQTTVAPPQTTVAPAQATVAPPQTTLAPADTTLAPAENTPGPAGPQRSRSKRSVLSPPTKSSSDGCNCKNEAVCECGTNIFNNRVSQYANDVSYVCFKVTTKGNDTDVIIRGCAPTFVDGKAPCDTAIAANTKSCSTCSTDKCNGSFVIQYSTFMLAATIGLMVLK